MIKVECGWCQKPLGEKPGEGESHGMCPECAEGWIEDKEENKEAAK